MSCVLATCVTLDDTLANICHLYFILYLTKENIDDHFLNKLQFKLTLILNPDGYYNESRGERLNLLSLWKLQPASLEDVSHNIREQVIRLQTS